MVHPRLLHVSGPDPLVGGGIVPQHLGPDVVTNIAACIEQCITTLCTVYCTQYTVFTLLTSYKEAAANTDSAHCLPGGWKLANKLPLRSAWGQGLRGGECVTSAVFTPGNYEHLQPTTR